MDLGPASPSPGKGQVRAPRGCFLSRLSEVFGHFHHLSPVPLVFISISSFYCHLNEFTFHLLVLITRVEKALLKKKNVPCIQSVPATVDASGSRTLAVCCLV